MVNSQVPARFNITTLSMPNNQPISLVHNNKCLLRKLPLNLSMLAKPLHELTSSCQLLNAMITPIRNIYIIFPLMNKPNRIWNVHVRIKPAITAQMLYLLILLPFTHSPHHVQVDGSLIGVFSHITFYLTLDMNFLQIQCINCPCKATVPCAAMTHVSGTGLPIPDMGESMQHN